MEQTIQTISQREPYQPSLITRFFWWLSTAEEQLLINCSVDRNRYAITGMAVLGTWLFATLAWSYFFSTVVDQFFVAILLGIFMGGIILTIDRALIKGINARNKFKLTPLLFRLVLATTIGTFMAQPALLYLFDKEIHAQISLDNEARKMAKLNEIDSLFARQKNELQAEKAALQSQLDKKYNEVSASRNAFIAETDGTGGSGKIGLKDIARSKQNEYLKLDGEYKLLAQNIQPQISAVDSALTSIATAKIKEQQSFETLLNEGFLTRIEALHNLIKANSAALFRYYLLIIILVLIELMPVIAKMLLPAGSYDEKVRLREQMEKNIAASNSMHEEQLIELYNKLSFEKDSACIHEFFKEAEPERSGKLKDKLQRWKQNGHSFDSMWQQIKRDVLTKQES